MESKNWKVNLNTIFTNIVELLIVYNDGQHESAPKVSKKHVDFPPGGRVQKSSLPPLPK